jgi:hypothetical protein
MATTNQIASYNGRNYKVLWIGATKYGRRAHLAFLDGSKDFWVDAARVSQQGQFDPHAGTGSGVSSPRYMGHGRCRECGGPIKDAKHHRAMGGLCGECAFDEYDC